MQLHFQDCRHCKGAGRVPLPAHLTRTLALFSPTTALTATDVHASVREAKPTTIEAMNGRLEDLRSLGLLKRVRAGRVWIYSLPETTTNERPGTTITRATTGHGRGKRASGRAVTSNSTPASA